MGGIVHVTEMETRELQDTTRRGQLSLLPIGILGLHPNLYEEIHTTHGSFKGCQMVKGNRVLLHCLYTIPLGSISTVLMT